MTAALNFIHTPPELQPALAALYDWALTQTASVGTRSHASAAIMLVTQNVRAYANSNVTTAAVKDARQSAYSVRVVLHKPDGDIDDCSPWEHGIVGLDAVWSYIEELGPSIHEPRGITACPTELTAVALKDRENTTRVTMSRKANKIAAIRVPHAVIKQKGGLVQRHADGTSTQMKGKPEAWVLRIDVGPFEAGMALDKAERENGSPLVRD